MLESNKEFDIVKFAVISQRKKGTFSLRRGTDGTKKFGNKIT